MRFETIRRAALALVAAMTLSACDELADSVGDGVKPESLVMTSGRFEGSAATNDFKGIVYQCTTTALRVFGLFSNGSSEDFTSRATFSSSDESVVRVSNADLPVPGTDNGEIFFSGVLLPVNPGNAVITVDFVGLSTELDVEVRPLTAADLSIEPTDLTMAAGTFEPFTLLGQLDGDAPETLGGNVIWEFDSDSNADAVTVSEIGVVQAHEVDAAVQILKPRLQLCDGSGPTSVPTADILVSAVDQLTVSSEFDGDLAGGETIRRIAGTNEFLRAIAHFSNGETQDITEFQLILTGDEGGTRPLIEWTSSDDTVAAFTPGSNFLSLFPDQDGSTDITAAYRPLGEETPLATSAAFTLEAVDGTITELRISPDTDVEIESLGSLRFTSEADFSSDSGPVTQTLTRHTQWASDDTSLVSISSALGFSGIAQSLQRVTEADITVDITGIATFGGASADDTVTVSILRTECSDGIDNDNDGDIDTDDDGCGNEFGLDESADDT